LFEITHYSKFATIRCTVIPPNVVYVTALRHYLVKPFLFQLVGTLECVGFCPILVGLPVCPHGLLCIVLCRVRTIPVLGYRVLGDICMYWVVSVSGDIFSAVTPDTDIVVH